MRSTLLEVLKIILILSSSALCDSSVDMDRPVKVGMLLTLSGDFAKSGEDCRMGIQAAINLSENGSVLKPLFADSNNDPATAISEFRKLVTVDEALLVYTNRSAIGMPLNPTSLRSKVPLLGAVGHKDFTRNNKYAFQVWPRSDLEGEFVANHFIEQGLKRVATIYTEDEWTSAIADGFRKKLKELGGTLVADEPVLQSERDFRTLFLKLKQKSPQVIYLNILLPQVGVAVKQARELALHIELYSNFYTPHKDVLDTAGEALEGVKYVEMDTNLPALKKSLGLDPNTAPQGLTVASYIATFSLIQAVSSLKEPPTKSNIYSALLKQKEIVSPDRTYKVSDRYVDFPLVVKGIYNGKGELILSK